MNKNYSQNNKPQADLLTKEHIKVDKVNKILLIEDDEIERIRLSSMLTRLFPTVTIDCTAGCNAAREKLKWTKIPKIGPYDFIIADMYYPDLDTGLGLMADLLDTHKKQYSKQNLLLVSSSPLEQISQKGTVKLPVQFLQKPFDFLSLKNFFLNSVRVKYYKKNNNEHVHSLDGDLKNPQILENVMYLTFIAIALYLLFLT